MTWEALCLDSRSSFGRYAIVLISNQAIKFAALATWKEKIPLIGQAVSETRASVQLSVDWPRANYQLSQVPFRILAATQKDQYRKPMPGMWYEIERIFREEGVEIGMQSFGFAWIPCSDLLQKIKPILFSSVTQQADSIPKAKEISQARTANGRRMLIFRSLLLRYVINWCKL